MVWKDKHQTQTRLSSKGNYNFFGTYIMKNVNMVNLILYVDGFLFPNNHSVKIKW